MADKILASKNFLEPIEDKIYDTITSTENENALKDYIKKKIYYINETEFKY